MSLTVSNDILEATTCSGLARLRTLHEDRHYRKEEIEVPTGQLSDADLEDLKAAAEHFDDAKSQRAIDAILQSRQGKFSHVVPNFKAFESMLRDFLKANVIDGWLYVRGQDGKLNPELVTSIDFDAGRDIRGSKPSPSVTVHTAYYGRATDHRSAKAVDLVKSSHRFVPADVTRQRIGDVLAKADLFKETPELKQEYLQSFGRHGQLIAKSFAKQFRFTGKAAHYEDDNWRRRGQEEFGRKVVHDLDEHDYAAFKHYVESELHDAGDGPLPEHCTVRCFDLRRHEFFWVHSDYLEPYVYDKSLRDKLVLPSSHRDLLDVLTSDLDAFATDIVEGKAAGNIILCKGVPGVGKTLSAEVYSELIEAPLYSIHSGTLGTSAKDIDANLQVIFGRAKRWNCVLLLDEADVFVIQRGDSLAQNAIVAEFLRVLEYFDGLMFMTTNRPDDIDDAIISRCAAIVAYHPPGPEHAAAIWGVMAKQFQASLSEALVGQLVQLFPTIAPRDIKMLLRLALRVAARRNEALDIDLFRRCAMFRAVQMADLAG